MRWSAPVEKAWLSLFRFIEFWMGIPYMQPNELDSTLGKVMHDPRLPGGHIDTEYIHEISMERADDITEEVIREEETGSSQSNLNEDLPPWLKKHEHSK